MREGKARVVAVLGAESTGKTALARELAGALADAQGLRCTWVGEWLREWCEREGRTPRPEEQWAIAQMQSQRIEQALQNHDVVVADTTALMTAVYSQCLFQDTSLLADALATQGRYALTLVMANDLPWVADPTIRDGPHMREPVRKAIVQALLGAAIAHHEVAGAGRNRLACALRVVRDGLGLA